jgi:hypothetical protein
VNAVEVPVTLTRGRTPSVEVVVAADAATLTGRVTDEITAVVVPVVVVFPTDSDRWFSGSQYVRQASAARNGTFTIHSLPPGDYWVVALDDLPPDPTLSNWQDASLLSELIARASRVQLDPSKRVAIELSLSSVYR